MAKRFFLSVAVSEYADRDCNLGGVRKDAERLRSIFQDHADDRKLDMKWLPDGHATKSGIENALREITDKAGESDQAVVYFGGHGLRKRDEETGKEWKHYFLPYETNFKSEKNRMALHGPCGPSAQRPRRQGQGTGGDS